MDNTLNLRKEKVLELKKKLSIPDQKAQVVLCLDYSGSMSAMYYNGSVQALVERILPLGLAFDDNGEVDMYLFDTKCRKVTPNITLSNISGYVKREIIEKDYDMGSTSYAPTLKRVTSDFAHEERGIFGGVKGYEKMDLPVFVIFITDGENGDYRETEKQIIDSSRAGIFFQFVGIGRESFNFLRKLDTLNGRYIDNANFFTVADLSQKTDEDLYALLLNEFPLFVVQARNKGMIK